MASGETYQNAPKAEVEKNETIMSEALEALLGAICCERGLGKTTEVLVELLP